MILHEGELFLLMNTGVINDRRSLDIKERKVKVEKLRVAETWEQLC